MPTDTPEIPVDTPEPEATEDVEPTDIPPAESDGTIDEVVGQVTMITPGGEEIPVTADTPIVAGSQFLTGADGQLTFTLDDESIVQLIEMAAIRKGIRGDIQDSHDQDFTAKFKLHGSQICFGETIQVVEFWSDPDSG